MPLPAPSSVTPLIRRTTMRITGSGTVIQTTMELDLTPLKMQRKLMAQHIDIVLQRKIHHEISLISPGSLKVQSSSRYFRTVL